MLHIEEITASYYKGTYFELHLHRQVSSNDITKG